MDGKRGSPLRMALAMGMTMALGACATPPLNEGDPSFPAGSTITLNTPLRIRAGDARVDVGPGYTPSDLAHTVSCELEVRTLSDGNTVVQPDRFTVLGTSPDREVLTGGGFSFGFNSMPRLGEGTSLVYVIRNVYLQSPRQPDVLRVSCRQLRDGNESRFLSADLMRAALAGAMTVGG